MQNYITHYQSEIAMLEITASESAIISLYFVEDTPIASGDMPSVLRECVLQIEAYFKANLCVFDLPLQFSGTPFQNRVWQELTQIPCAETISYAELACRIGRPGAYRAVGNANGKNPISIIAPCHRVVGSNGSLTGYGGGLWRKKWLLAHELKMKHSLTDAL